MIRQTVLSAYVGGAASAPLDSGVWVAPMRDAQQPSRRTHGILGRLVVSGTGPNGDLLFPPRARMDRLCRYLGVR